MARTQITGQQVGDGTVQRADLDVSTAGSAVIRKVLAGTGVSLVSTGPDSGTGDVTISAASAVQSAAPVTVTFSATVTLDCSVSSTFDLTLTGNTTVSLSNATDGQRILLRLKQDATGGRTTGFGTMVRYGTDIPILTLTSTASKLDYIGFIYNTNATKYDVVSFVRGY